MAAQEAVWLQRVFEESVIPIAKPTKNWSDNQSAIRWSVAAKPHLYVRGMLRLGSILFDNWWIIISFLTNTFRQKWMMPIWWGNHCQNANITVPLCVLKLWTTLRRSVEIHQFKYTQLNNLCLLIIVHYNTWRNFTYRLRTGQSILKNRNAQFSRCILWLEF